MIGSDAREVERKVISILRVLKDSPEPLGARVVARELKNHGVNLTERAVRYHLKFMDERGLTISEGRDGRLLTELGRQELKDALVSDKVGFVINKIEVLAFRTTFDWEKRTGMVPINISIFSEGQFSPAREIMKRAFEAGICVSPLVAAAEEGERLGETIVPKGKIGFATVCSIIINGCLLKAGIPLDSRFGGVLQIRNHKPVRFIHLIEYAGSSLDPSEIFIRGKMTSVGGVVAKGEGKVLANFREIPAQCRELAEEVVAKLKECSLNGLLLMGNTSEPVCEIPVGLNRVGVVLLGGLNPVAAVEEAGIEADNIAMSGAVEYSKLKSFWEL